jgi:succinate dehydrogenase flavin-adding protein (antitoxin of CptAB toxin-antitoxin module)
MTKINDVYYEAEKLIKILVQENETQLAGVLNHRMYKVSWTSREELLDELDNVLKNYVHTRGDNIDKKIADQIMKIIEIIQQENV